MHRKGAETLTIASNPFLLIWILTRTKHAKLALSKNDILLRNSFDHGRFIFICSVPRMIVKKN